MTCIVRVRTPPFRPSIKLCPRASKKERKKKTADVIFSLHPQDFSPHLFVRFYRVNCVFVAAAVKNRSSFFEEVKYFLLCKCNKILTCQESMHTAEVCTQFSRTDNRRFSDKQCRTVTVHGIKHSSYDMLHQ